MRTVSGRTECLPHCASRAHSISSSSQSSRKTNLSCIHFASRRPLKSSAMWPTVWSWNNVGKYQCRAKGHLCIKLADLTHHDHVSLQGNQRFEIPTLNQLHDKITRNFCCCEICSISPFPRNFNAFLFKAQNTPPLPPPATNTSMGRLHDLCYEDFFNVKLTTLHSYLQDVMATALLPLYSLMKSSTDGNHYFIFQAGTV